MKRQELIHRILHVQEDQFEQVTLDLFHYQYSKNPIYRQFCQLLDRTSDNVATVAEIPCLPIRAFRTHSIKTNVWQEEVVFESSGTTHSDPSRLYVRDLKWYLDLAVAGFSAAFAPPQNYVWLFLLPGYLERPNSSLVAMADRFARQSSTELNGFFLNDLEALHHTLMRCEDEDLAVNLFGVSHALLDFSERYPRPLRNTRIFETGGMKGRRPEMPKADLHRILCEAFSLDAICSEYGMTELLSQAWSHGQGIYRPNATLRIMIRDVRDPLAYVPDNKRGGVNCIDLANIDTCAFIATDDLGIRYADRSFSILGRLDNSDLRGCNLMLADYY